MIFLWPEFLVLLLVVPALVVAYLLSLRRKKKLALRYPSLAIVKDAMGPAQRIRRHIPPLLFLTALTSMIVAIARPASVITLPLQYETVILAIDTSLSMRAEDVAPSRIAAAQGAARHFIAEQPRNTRIGVVSFAGSAQIVQAPTLDHQQILSVLDELSLQSGTAIGSGILVSLQMIFPDIAFNLWSDDPRPGNAHENPASASLDKAPKAQMPGFTPVAPGSYTSAVIILLTDGQATTGPNPIEAARMAADRGVRVFTVGIGTTNGGASNVDDWSLPVLLDEQTLQQIAGVTKAEYFYAGSAPDLSRIYKTLRPRLFLEKKETEISALFSAAAVIFSLASGFLSLLWFNRSL